ncbi:MAG TPA: CaiB/BaiF CoA-transferase family protein [Tepidiformaceae bacterium]|jgi:crotonobetainyl-CoA:carnitine CoA-transferase CaiB-like acyl-CoA transferase
MSGERPLDGLRVLELADEQAEWAGKLLADMGADVIKVESPGGATTRRIGPFVGDVPDPERSLNFWHYNTSKRSVTLDLATRQGRALWLELAARADVVLETAVPGALDALGIGYEALALTNPGLVMTSVTPWGPDGPYAGFVSGDLIQMAMSGIINSCGYDEHDIPPVRPGANHSHHIASHHAVIGTLIALYARDALGKGQRVDIAVHDCASVCVEFAATHWFYTQRFVERQTGRHAYPQITARSSFLARDGHYASMSQTRDERVWREIVRWAHEAGLGELFDQFGDATDRFARGSEVLGAYEALVAEMDSEEIWHRGQELGMTWAAVRQPEDWLDDPHAIARGFFHPIEHEGLAEPVYYPGPPYAFTAHPGRLTRAPHLGEHNAEVYGALGYSAADLTAFREAGAI